MVQKLLDQDHRDSTGALRNNVMVSLDASAARRRRLAASTASCCSTTCTRARRRSRTSTAGRPVGAASAKSRGTRVSWNAEYTWLSRYVYTSFFGRSFTAQDRPLGFPTGPGFAPAAYPGHVGPHRELAGRGHRDAHRDRCRGTRRRLRARRTRTRSGHRSPACSNARARVEGTLRWWPAGGVDLSIARRPRPGRERRPRRRRRAPGLARDAGLPLRALKRSASRRGAIADRRTRDPAGRVRALSQAFARAVDRHGLGSRPQLPAWPAPRSMPVSFIGRGLLPMTLRSLLRTATCRGADRSRPRARDRRHACRLHARATSTPPARPAATSTSTPTAAGSRVTPSPARSRRWGSFNDPRRGQPVHPAGHPREGASRTSTPRRARTSTRSAPTTARAWTRSRPNARARSRCSRCSRRSTA